MSDFDVLIAGAGPAGTACALALAKYGYNIGLIDQTKKTSFQIGESIPGASIRLLNRLGIHGISSLLKDKAYEPCLSNASAWGTDEWQYQDSIYNPEGGGWHICRQKFDESLRQQVRSVGCKLHMGKVDKISIVQDSRFNFDVTITATNNCKNIIRSKWLIDASGRSRIVSRNLGTYKKGKECDQMALVFWVNSSLEDQDLTTRVKSVEKGWWYTTKLPNNIRVMAFFGNPSDVSDLFKNKSIIDVANKSQVLPFELRDNNCILEVRVQKADVSLANSIVGNYWFSIGDAALTLDPLSSQGIFFALYSAIKCSETLVKIDENQMNFGSLKQKYHSIILDVYEHHQKFRKQYYNQEKRYASSDFWSKWFLHDTTNSNQNVNY